MRNIHRRDPVCLCWVTDKREENDPILLFIFIFLVYQSGKAFPAPGCCSQSSIIPVPVGILEVCAVLKSKHHSAVRQLTEDTIKKCWSSSHLSPPGSSCPSLQRSCSLWLHCAGRLEQTQGKTLLFPAWLFNLSLRPALLRVFRLDLVGWFLRLVPSAHGLPLLSACLPSGSLQSSAKAGAACAARIIRVLQGA